ncbi:MAG: PspA/IM30 family protein [Eubacterium sp.]|nr:PspA/IM30 family protein [Eubacterium sp.]
MGILGRFKDIMASNIHAIFNREDKHPEQTVEKYLGQLRRDLGQVKAETEALKMEYNRAQRAVDENEDEQAKLERYLERAREAKSTSDARTFERKLEKVREDGTVLAQKLAQAKEDMDKLAALNEKLGGDISTLEAKLSEIKGTLSAASQQEQLNKMAKKAGAANSDEMFSQMSERANYALDKANAMAELEAGPSAAADRELESLTEKYDSDI